MVVEHAGVIGKGFAFLLLRPSELEIGALSGTDECSNKCCALPLYALDVWRRCSTPNTHLFFSSCGRLEQHKMATTKVKD